MVKKLERRLGLIFLGKSRSSSDAQAKVIREIEQENPLYKNIPIYLSRFGLRTWEETVC